jgi:25S rRNA (uracil2634-N3)-methyltransferase
LLGDFSFARSLAVQHRCRNILATCYDSEETLYSKYPQAKQHVDDLLGAFSKKEHQNDPDGSETEKARTQGKENGEEQSEKKQDRKRRGPNVLFAVDARKLGSVAGGGKDVRTGFARRERKRPAWQESRQKTEPATSTGGPWDIICFNFPHVGGLSTDVNRQVRSNQELLVAFFKACVPLLSARPQVLSDDDEDEGEDNWSSSEDNESDSGEQDDQDILAHGGRGKYRTDPGQILVTMFEGEPYTLWNIKDLARHAGLRVVTSFRFPWSSYQGYSHARTLGEIEGKHGGRGGWRGEDREARMYVFEVKQEGGGAPPKHSQAARLDTKGKNNKRSRNLSDSDDSD